MIEFGRDVVHRPLDPWQEWLVVHAGEMLPDGRPRFRIVLVLVSRQNGKTELLVILSLYWQFVVAVPLILGTSTKLDYAKESWFKAVKLAGQTQDFDGLRGPGRWIREANGEQESWTAEGSRYKIAASNEEGGRSLTIWRLILDELRQHHSYAAWDAAEPACSPLDAQIWALSNMGDDRSVVLNDLRAAAIEFIETGEGDPRVGLFEWSAPPGADPRDPRALAQANPNYGRRLDRDALLGAAHRAVAAGGEALTGFRTERMCVRVPHTNPAIDPSAWQDCLDVGDLAAVRGRVATCFDLAPDGLHATLVAAAVLADGRVRLEVVRAWSGPGCTDEARRDLPGLLARVRPRVLGWLPAGPAAAVAADLKPRSGWPPPGVTVEEIKAETAACCLGLAEQVTARRIAHSDDPLLNAQAAGVEWAPGARVFSRKGGGHCDAVYAAAGAAHLARTLPPPIGKPRLVVADDS